jgi:hypothetical protein
MCPDHNGFQGNGDTDALAKMDQAIRFFFGPEPQIQISPHVGKPKIKEWPDRMLSPTLGHHTGYEIINALH